MIDDIAATDTDVLVIGAGIVGIAVAHAIRTRSPRTAVTLVDDGAPMAFTSAQSGENYRNWWPHPIMKRFVEDSIDLMESLSAETNGHVALTRGGYALATRSMDVDALLTELAGTYGEGGAHGVRVHGRGDGVGYEPSGSGERHGAVSGVDVLTDASLVRRHFPSFDPSVKTVLHVRRGGTVASQPLGQRMLERFRDLGGRRLTARVSGIEVDSPFTVRVETPDGATTLRADRIVNAAGPHVGDVAAMLGITLPVHNVLQQKIAFEDVAGAIPRGLPFSIDVDARTIDWSDEERELLREEPSLRRYLDEMPGGTHCRPEGGERGRWIKLGWAWNAAPAPASREPELDPNFPEIVLRGAMRLHPALAAYAERFPRNMTHYGGYYTMTEENWPLIGPLGVENAFVAGAMSGFGTMAACAAGELTAKWVLGEPLPEHAAALSPERHDDAVLMTELRGSRSRGIL